MYNPVPPPFSDPSQSPDAKRQKVNSIWKIISTIYLLVALGLSAYWELTNAWPCLMVREWQLSISDDSSYYPILDILVCFLVVILPLFVVKIIIQKTTGVKIENPNFKR